MKDKEINKVLNNLIEILRDGEEGFKTASTDVKDALLKNKFKKFAEERASLAEELSDYLEESGEEASETGSTAGVVHRGWIDLKSALGGGEKSILNEAERGEDYAVNAFREALEEELPTEVETLIRKQFATVKATHDAVKTLRDTWV